MWLHGHCDRNWVFKERDLPICCASWDSLLSHRLSLRCSHRPIPHLLLHKIPAFQYCEFASSVEYAHIQGSCPLPLSAILSFPSSLIAAKRRARIIGN